MSTPQEQFMQDLTDILTRLGQLRQTIVNNPDRIEELQQEVDDITISLPDILQRAVELRIPPESLAALRNLLNRFGSTGHAPAAFRRKSVRKSPKARKSRKLRKSVRKSRKSVRKSVRKSRK